MPFLVYHEHPIVLAAHPARSSERSLHPRGDDQEASYVLDIFNVSQRFREDFTRYEWEFQPFALAPRPGSSHLVQSQFPWRVKFILASFFSRVCLRQRETIKGE